MKTSNCSDFLSERISELNKHLAETNSQIIAFIQFRQSLLRGIEALKEDLNDQITKGGDYDPPFGDQCSIKKIETPSISKWIVK